MAMIRAWVGVCLVAGLASFGVHASVEVPPAETQLDDEAALLGLVDRDDEVLDQLTDTPDQRASQLYDLNDVSDPELEAIFFSGVPSGNADLDVCKRSGQEIQALAYEASSRISVYNQGGLLNGGVCWWHSRFQRASLYLATYRPDLPKPTLRQALAIINALATLSRVVVIPGYKDFHSFTHDYEHEIIRRLEAWQKYDGFKKFRWVDGLSGKWRVRAWILELVMNRINDLINVQHEILFEKLHLHKAFESHAYLVIGSRKTEAGYELDVVDSNFPGRTIKIPYKRGDTSLYVGGGHTMPFVPYLDFRGDMAKIRGALKRFCSQRSE